MSVMGSLRQRTKKKTHCDTSEFLKKKKKSTHIAKYNSSNSEMKSGRNIESIWMSDYF